MIGFFCTFMDWSTDNSESKRFVNWCTRKPVPHSVVEILKLKQIRIHDREAAGINCKIILVCPSSN